jgi:hypothetical protein
VPDQTSLQVGLGTPFEAQLAFFRRKLNLPTERWDDIQRSAHDRAFIVAGAAQADLLQDLRAAVDRTLAEGGSAADFKRRFRATVAAHGWTGWTGEGSERGLAWRANVIYGTNLASSYAAGRWRQMTDPGFAKLYPYWRYRHADGVLHPRPLHLSWDGLTLPIGHAFWRTHFAPNGWGCQCKIFAAKGPAPGAATSPPEGWDAIDAKTGAPVGIDRGFDYAPGAAATAPMQQFIDQKLLALDAPIGAAMWQRLRPVLALERQQRWWRTLDAWLADPLPRGRTAVVGVMDSSLLDALSAAAIDQPTSAAVQLQDRLVIGTKQKRHEDAQNGLVAEEWRALPTLIERPSGVYQDTRSGHLILVADGTGPEKVALEYSTRAAPQGATWIVSAFRVSALDIAGAVKGGQWKVVQVSGTRLGSNQPPR